MKDEEMAKEWIKDHSGLIGSYEYVKYDYDSMQQAFLAGLKAGYHECEKEHVGKYKTAYIKGIRTMANALKDYDRTDGAWTDYFEHTVDNVLKKLLGQNIKDESQEAYKELCENYSSNKLLYTDGFSDGYKECQKEHEWHYVKDGLPTNTGLYLIFYYNSFFNDKVRCIARYSPDRKEFLNLNIEDGDEVIAWQVLPALPKEIE